MTGFLILKIFHIAFAGTWFGTGISMSGDIRRTLAMGRPHTESLVTRINRTTKVTIACGWLTLLTGVGVIFSTGGFGSLPWRITVGGALTLVIFAIGGFLARPTWGGIVSVIEGGGDLAAARPLVRRFGMISGIIQTLWLAVLVLMVVPFK
jgi:hypothetical protein